METHSVLAVSHTPEHAPLAGVLALRIGEVTLRLADRMLLDAAGQEVPLRRSEFALLLAFARNHGRVLSRDQLLDAVSGRRAEPFDRSIDVLVGRLRRKIEVDPKRPRLIQTVSGLGYKLALKPRPVALPLAAEEGALAEDVPKSAPHLPERRQLTVLRCALADAAHIAARLDPEDWRRVIAAVHDGCDGIIARFGGLVVSPRGDNVVAYFGYPEAHENDAERAIRAGLDMIAATAKLAPDLPASVAAKVGIATGIVVVGDLLDPHAQTALGEAPVLAVRLASEARVGSVVISESTRRLVSGLFAYQAMSANESFWVLGEGEAASRFEALRGPDLTRFVGREEEIALLLRRWRRAVTGAGRVVHISGEPGIGKSRLVREFQNEIATGTATAMSCFCAPLHQDSTYYPIIREIEYAAGFRRSDAPVERLGKLEALLQGSGTSPEGIALIADLLSVPTGDRYPPLDLSPRQRRDRTVQTLLARVEAMARHEPVLVVFEDVHWIDPSSREMLDALIERISERPILLILTARPDFSPSWPGAVVVDTLVLNRLEDADVTGMIEAVGGELPNATRRQIVARADGVPLYVEELTRTAVEVGAVSLPATLSDSLMARLDRVPAAKVVAQIGAVIGRSFSHELLAAMAERPEEVSGLDQLLASGLVSRRGGPPDATYTFKHALVQDAAYESLLKSRRAALHARLVDVLIAREPDIEDTRPDVLAHHCEQAGLIERAIEYYVRAGWRTFDRAALKEARELFGKARRLGPMLPEEGARDRAELQALHGIGVMVAHTVGYGAEEFGSCIARAAALCERIGYPPEFARISFLLFTFQRERGDLRNALATGERLYRWASSRNDIGGRVLGDMSVGAAHAALGDLVAARQHLERALELYNAHRGDPALIWTHQVNTTRYVVRMASENGLALLLCWLGYPEQALAHIAAAGKLAEDEDRFVAEAVYLWHHLWVLSFLCDPSELSAPAEKLAALSREQAQSQFAMHGAMMLGYATAHRGDPEIGQRLLGEAIAAYVDDGALFGACHFRALLAETHLMMNETSAALAILAEALEETQRTGEKWYDAELHRWIGEAHRQNGNEVEAARWFEQALAIARAQDAKLWELNAAASFARLLRDQRKPAVARALLSPIYGWFSEGFDTVPLRRAKTLLDALNGADRSA